MALAKPVFDKRASKARKSDAKRAVVKKAVKRVSTEKAPAKKVAKVRAAKAAKSARIKLAARSAVRTAFVTRSVRLIERLAATAPEDGLVDALAAPTDVGTLARALSSSAVVGPAVGELEPLAVLIAKSAEDKQVLIRQAGGLLSTNEVASLLGLTRQAVYLQRRARKLLAVPHGGEEQFPAVQFADGQPLPGLARVLAAVRLEGPWGTLDFLLAPDDALEGLTPIEVLRDRPDLLGGLLSLAATQGAHGAG
jgi:hypothetical protein